MQRDQLRWLHTLFTFNSHQQERIESRYGTHLQSYLSA